MTNIIKKLYISISEGDRKILNHAKAILRDIADEIKAAQDNDEEVVIEASLNTSINAVGAAFDSIPNVYGSDEDEDWEETEEEN